MSDTITKRTIKHELENDGYQAAYDEIAIACAVKATQVAGRTWRKMDGIEVVSSHTVDDANDVPTATFHLTEGGDFLIEEYSSGRTFLVKLTNIIGAACAAIQFMDTHANNAHIARFYAENFHPDQEDMIAALKMVERGGLYPALD